MRGTRLCVCPFVRSCRSPAAGELETGAVVEVIATAVLPGSGVVRVKFSEAGGLIGWCSMATAAGDTLLEPLGPRPAASSRTYAAVVKQGKTQVPRMTLETASAAASAGPIPSTAGSSGSANTKRASRGAENVPSKSPLRAVKPVRSTAELQRTVPFPATDFLAALAAAEAEAAQATQNIKAARGKQQSTAASSSSSRRAVTARISAANVKELHSLLLRRLEGIFAKCVVPNGGSDDHIAAETSADAERAAMATSLAACMSPEQIAEMIENTERSHEAAAEAQAKQEERKRRNGLDTTVAVY